MQSKPGALEQLLQEYDQDQHDKYVFVNEQVVKQARLDHMKQQFIAAS